VEEHLATKCKALSLVPSTEGGRRVKEDCLKRPSTQEAQAGEWTQSQLVGPYPPKKLF
jgi:hypothetical protein